MTSFVLSLRSLFRILRFLKQRLKALLGCLWLSWSRFLREVKRVTQHVLIGAEDEAKDGDQGSSGQSSLPKASPGSYKGDGVICASSIPASLSEPDLRRSTPDSDDASGFISLRPLVSRSPSAPEFTVNVPQDSPRADSPQLLLDSPRRVDSPYRAETPFDSDRPRANNPLTIVELRTPRVLTPHPRTTSRQFSGVPSRASSRSPSPFRRRSSVFRTSKRHGSTSQLSNSEGTHTPPVRTGVTGALPARPESPGSPTLDIYIQPPSRPGTPGSSQHTQPSYHSRHSLQHGSSSSLVMQTEILDSLSISSSAASRRSRHRSGSPQGPIPQNVGHGDPQATFSTQQDPDTFPFPQASPATNGYRITGTRYMQPMHSDQVSRYVRKYDVPQEESSFRLMPLTVNLPHSYKFPDSGDWTPVTSPGGALYFYHDRWRIYTDVYMYDPGLRTEVNEFAARLADRREMQTFPTDDYDLVLDVTTMKDSGEIIWSYYYVDHKTRTLFWLQHYDASETLLYEAFGIQEPGHMKLRLEALYWVHWSLYPVGHGSRVFPRDACEKLLGILTSCSVDLLTSKRSTAPYSVADMQTMFSLIKEAKGSDAAAEHVRSSTARLLSFFTHWKFIHFHGQRTSRLDRFKSIHNDDKGRRTILIRSLSAPLFLAPEVHLRELKKLWTDNIIIEAFWKEFMQKLVSEWIEFVLYSTVMLAANVAFLAIQGVIVIPQDPSSKNWIKPSPAQIISSISLVFSVGSIITGLVLIRHNRTMMLQEPKVASEYLTKKHSRRFGLEPLAIIFSLTYALLMWSVWMFFVSLLLFSFQNTTMAIRIALSIAAGIVTIFIIWCILNSWDTGEREEEALILSNEHEPITP